MSVSTRFLSNRTTVAYFSLDKLRLQTTDNAAVVKYYLNIWVLDTDALLVLLQMLSLIFKNSSQYSYVYFQFISIITSQLISL